MISPVNIHVDIKRALLCLQQIWPGLRTVEYELSIETFLQQHVKEGERCQAANRAALIHLEAQVINVACDDPGRAVGATVLLPMLRERIESQAYAHFNKHVLLAEQKVCPASNQTIHQSINLCIYISCLEDSSRKSTGHLPASAHGSQQNCLLYRLYRTLTSVDSLPRLLQLPDVKLIYRGENSYHLHQCHLIQAVMRHHAVKPTSGAQSPVATQF